MLNLTLSRETGGSVHPLTTMSFSASVLDKQTYLSIPCPARVRPASVSCIYLLPLARAEHYSLKPLSESEGLGRASIRRPYLYGESTDARALGTCRHCNLHRFQESDQTLFCTFSANTHSSSSSIDHAFNAAFACGSDGYELKRSKT